MSILPLDRLKNQLNKENMLLTLTLYVLVGVVATIVDWGTFFLLNYFFRLFYILAVSCSFTLGALTHFILNRTYTFQNRYEKIGRQYLVHLSISIVSLLVTILLMFLFVQFAAMPKFTARVATSLIVVFLNFTAHRKITFGLMQ